MTEEIRDVTFEQFRSSLTNLVKSFLEDPLSDEVFERDFSDFVKLKDNISYNPNVRRRSLYMDFVISVAGNEFNTYMEVNQPSTNIIQERPEYTNISNGLGIFSSRYIKNQVSASDTRPIRFQLNPQSLIELETGSYTSNLGFID